MKSKEYKPNSDNKAATIGWGSSGRTEKEEALAKQLKRLMRPNGDG